MMAEGFGSSSVIENTRAEAQGIWQKKGKEILLNELNAQIHHDGLNKEQALAYHFFVFDFYLLSCPFSSI